MIPPIDTVMVGVSIMPPNKLPNSLSTGDRFALGASEFTVSAAAVQETTKHLIGHCDMNTHFQISCRVSVRV
nr:hypothetical protein CFP56_30820 [Quercus suber]